jgi:hypothetical protein
MYLTGWHLIPPVALIDATHAWTACTLGKKLWPTIPLCVPTVPMTMGVKELEHAVEAPDPPGVTAGGLVACGDVAFGVEPVFGWPDAAG